MVFARPTALLLAIGLPAAMSVAEHVGMRGVRDMAAHRRSASKAAAVSAPQASFCAPGDGWFIEFSDDFDADTIDNKTWTVAPPGSYNGAPADCRSATCLHENVYLEDGALVIRSDRDPKNSSAYTSGAVNTKNKRTWNQADGTFRLCVSAMLPGNADSAAASQGIWPAHWMMPNDDSCDPDEGEMDIVEMVSGDGLAESTYHWQGDWPAENCTYPSSHGVLTGNKKLKDWDSTFHEFGVERASTHIAFSIDGEVVANKSAADADGPLLWDIDFYLILNTALGGSSWPGEPDQGTTMPAYHRIDYVRQVRAER